MWFLAQILTWITGVRRYKVDIEWSHESWTHNIFRVWELLFGRREGIRCEMTASLYDGVVQYKAHTLEAKCALFEQRVRHLLKRLSCVRITIPVLALPNGLAIPASPYLFAIGFDNSGLVAFFGTTLSFTCTGSNLELFVGAQNNSADAVSGVTYNSVSMTSVDKWNPSSVIWDYSFHLNQPATGTHNIVLTDSNSSSGFVAASYTGCVTTGTLDAHTTNSVATNSTYTATLTTVTANAWMVTFIKNNNGDATTAVTGNLRQHSGQGFALMDNGPLAAGSHSCACSGAGSTTYWSTSLSFAPVTSTAWTKTLTETVTHTATGLHTPTRTLTQTIAHTASFLGQIVHAATLTQTITHTATFLRSITHVMMEAVTHTATLVKTATRTLSETITHTASLIKTGTRTLTEAIAHTATALKTPGRILVEYGSPISAGPNNPGTLADDALVGTKTWSNPSNATNSDNTYAVASAVDSLGAYGVATYSVRIVKSDGSVGTTEMGRSSYIEWPTTDTYQAYGSSTSLWGETWAASDINSANFGFVISAGGAKNGDYTRTQSHYLKATNFSFSIPSTAAIVGIIAEVEQKAVDNGLSGADAYVDHMRLSVYYRKGGITHTDTIVSGRGRSSTITESITHTATLIKTATRTLTQSIAHSDTIAAAKTFVRSYTETITHTASVIKTATRSLVETITHTATVLRTPSRTLSDAITHTASFFKTAPKTVLETITHSDVFTGNLTNTATLTETIHHTASLIRSTTHALTETLTHTATVLKTATRALTEAITHTDTLAYLRTRGTTLSEAISHTATVIRATTRVLTETLSHTATVIKTGSRSLVETITHTASVLKTPTKVLTETITHAATVLRVLTHVFTQTIAHTASLVKTGGKTLTQTITHTATFSRVFTAVRTFTETVSHNAFVLVNGTRVFWTPIAKATASVLTHIAKATAATFTYINKPSDSTLTHISKSSDATLTHVNKPSDSNWTKINRT